MPTTPAAALGRHKKLETEKRDHALVIAFLNQELDILEDGEKAGKDFAALKARTNQRFRSFLRSSNLTSKATAENPFLLNGNSYGSS